MSEYRIWFSKLSSLSAKIQDCSHILIQLVIFSIFSRLIPFVSGMSRQTNIN